MTHRTKKIISYVFTAAVLAGAAIWLGNKWIHPADVEFTDNAEVRRQIVPVNCRVQGYIREIRFREYEYVHKGDTLVVLDDSDLRLVLERAEAEYHGALAAKGETASGIGVASANASASEAAIAEAKVLMQNSEADLGRAKALLARDAITRQQYDGYETDYLAKKARYETLTRTHEASSSAVGESKSRIPRTQAGIEMALAALNTARLNLSYAVITAPCDGYASRLEIQTGQLVQPGQTLLDIIDSSDIWIEANYKETQTASFTEGAPVEIRVDAVPGVVFKGTVKAISRATGSSLSVLPQDNSSGNFVKVRRRIPVRIEFSAGNSPKEMARLRAGMNAECEVSKNSRH